MKKEAVSLLDLVGEQITINSVNNSSNSLLLTLSDGRFVLVKFHCYGSDEYEDPTFFTNESFNQFIKDDPFGAHWLKIITMEEREILMEDKRKYWQEERDKAEKADYERLRNKFENK